MPKIRLAAITERRLEATGWYVSILRQTPRDDGRKLKNCTIPSDPWWAYLRHPDKDLCVYADGATADAAILAAIPSDLRAALGRLESAVDSLRDCLQK